MTGPPLVLDAVIASDIARLATAAVAFGRRIEAVSPVVMDWPGLLGERAALDGLPAPTQVSSGGAARLVPCADGWIAINLARPSDLDLIPAWLALASPAPEELEDLDAAIGRCPGGALIEAAALVGLPVGLLGEQGATVDGGIVRTPFGPRPPRHRQLRVVDLSSLWAGPLCGRILATAGAHVTKVESTTRPDGARAGSPAFFDRLNATKDQVALDLTSPDGRAELMRFLVDADVVIESTRPRALEQLGIVAADLLAAADGPDVWVSITGHGRSSMRVAFGDDAAVAGGLVCSNRRGSAVPAHGRGADGRDDGPRFLADAVADPLAGLAAAAATLEALEAGDRVLLDVSMAGVAANVAATLPPASAP